MDDDTTLRKLVEEVTSKPGYTSAVGTRVVSVRRGNVVFELPRRPDLLQGDGVFHGGVITALADHAAGAAVTTSLKPNQFVVTVNLQTSFLLPADGELIRANATNVHLGTSLATASVEIAIPRGESSVLCAISTVILKVIARK